MQHWIKLNLLLRHVSESLTGVDSFFELARWLPSWCIFHISKVNGLLIDVSSVLPPTLTFPSPARAVLRFVSLLASIKFNLVSPTFQGACSPGYVRHAVSSLGRTSLISRGFYCVPPRGLMPAPNAEPFLRTISPPG